MVILFSNERVIRDRGQYFARIINFTDFLALLSARSPDYQLALSCDAGNRSGIEITRLTPVQGLDKPILELPYLENRYQSFLQAFRVARLLRARLLERGGDNRPMAVAAPGLNSITFVLSFLLPRRTRWYLFIRGDTRKTVDEIYRRSPLRRLMTSVIDLFQWRISYLLRRDRGQCFVFGEALKNKFYAAEAARTHVVSPLLSQDWLTTPRPDLQSRPDPGRVPGVLFVGRLSAEKNVAALIDACAAAKAGARRFKLTIVGDGPLEEQLKQQVASLGLGDEVRLTGRVSNGPQLIGIYDSHDVFCLPSRTEGTPRAVAESVARGVPVVASDVGSVRYMFSPGTVRLIAGFSAADILDALGRTIDSLEECRALARQRSDEARKHSFEFNVDRVHRIIRCDLGDEAVA